MTLVGAALAAKGGTQGPPTGGETANNLSMPAVQTESLTVIGANWAVPENAVLGIHYSYGCDVPETDGQFSYPNTSCVDNLSSPTVWYDAEECTDTVAPSPCMGLPVDRIYWQKVNENVWWADDDGISPDPGYVTFVDWGDALEAVSWNTYSVIRVETQPYSTRIPGFDPSLGTCADATADPESDCKVGFQMWHVSGQGITEHWGVRATEDAVSYNYDTPYQIIKTTNARLNLAKMAASDAVCSTPGGNPGDLPPDVGAWSGSGWGGTCTFYDSPYSVETSVGGKYVYGYNFRMRNVALPTACETWDKAGFWRLTFYAPDDVIFDDPNAPNVAPPASPAEVRVLPASEFSTAIAVPEGDPEEDDRLYAPVVDTLNNLTYIDICIIASSQDGGGGGNGDGGYGGGGDGGGPGGGGGGTDSGSRR
jgi:uncharacterized membrane protein YgcG